MNLVTDGPRNRGGVSLVAFVVQLGLFYAFVKQLTCTF